MVKVSETFPDVIKTQSSDSNNLPNDLRLINFTKRQKMGEVANSILRHQPKVREQYKITEITSVRFLVHVHLFENRLLCGTYRFWNLWKLNLGLRRVKMKEASGCVARRCRLRNLPTRISVKASRQLVSDTCRTLLPNLSLCIPQPDTFRFHTLFL